MTPEVPHGNHGALCTGLGVPTIIDSSWAIADVRARDDTLAAPPSRQERLVVPIVAASAVKTSRKVDNPSRSPTRSSAPFETAA